MRRWGLLVLTVAGLVALPVWPATAQSGPAAPTVSMKSFAFNPATLTVPAGTTVTWTYDETANDVPPGCESPAFQTLPGVNCPGHSVTAAATGADGQPTFDSGVHRADGFPYSVTFSTPGTYAYYCIVHGGPHPNNPLTAMNGTIIVTPAAAIPVSSGSQAPLGDSTGTSGSGQGVLPVTGGDQAPLGIGGILLAAAALGRRVRRMARVGPLTPSR